MAIPAFGSAGSYYSPGTNGTSAAIPVPASVAANDVILVDLYVETTNAVTPPAGFTEITTAPAATGAQAHTHRLFWKRATGADAGTYSFSWTGSVAREGVAVRYAGVVTSGNPYDTGAGAPTNGTTGSTAQTNTPTLSLTTQGVNRLLVWSGSSFDNGAWTPPSGFTERVDTGETLSVATLLRSAAGATGSLTGSQSSFTHTAWLLALLPSPATVTGTVAATLGGPTATVRGSAVVPFLKDRISAAALAVEVAWGADLTADPDTWSWTAITSDVRQSNGEQISITVGRADEADSAQPSQCTFTLDNRAGDYSLGGQARWWPYVRRNTPVRVLVDPGNGTLSRRFNGFVAGWTPDWDLTGTDAVVRVTCSGTLRRLAQFDAQITSAYRAAIEDDIAAGLVSAYWPMTDGAEATSFAEVVSGGNERYAMGWYLYDDRDDHKPAQPAANSDFGASEPLPTLNTAELHGYVPRYTATSKVAVRALIKFPDSGIPTTQQILFCDVTGSSDWVWVEYRTAGSPTDSGNLAVVCENESGSTVEDTEFVLGVNGGIYVMQLELVHSGGTINYALTLVPLDQGPEPTATVSTGNFSGSLGRLGEIMWNSHYDDEDDGVAPAEVIGPAPADLVVGHVVAYKDISEDFHLDELLGHDGETATARLQRLADEGGVSLTVVDAADPTNPRPQETDLMGPQFAGPLLPLLDDAAAVDGGVLYDGRDFGLSYVTRRYRYSRSPADLTIDVGASQLLDPFSPVDDDQRTCNRATVTRPGGTEQTFEDVDGWAGTAAIGAYDKSVTLNLYSDTAALRHAEWQVHLGTVQGYRYPQICFSLAKSTTLAADWVATEVGGRVDVVNLLDARTQFPGDEQSFVLEGYTEAIDQKHWDVVANCSPYEPYRAAVVATDTSDTGEHLGRADTDGTVLASSAAIGATSLSVTVTGALWTTDSAQYPMVLDVGGIPVTATACTGASSPQTFTVTGSTMTTAKAAGVAVSVWQPPTLGL